MASPSTTESTSISLICHILWKYSEIEIEVTKTQNIFVYLCVTSQWEQKTLKIVCVMVYEMVGWENWLEF